MFGNVDQELKAFAILGQLVPSWKNMRDAIAREMTDLIFPKQGEDEDEDEPKKFNMDVLKKTLTYSNVPGKRKLNMLCVREKCEKVPTWHFGGARDTALFCT